MAVRHELLESYSICCQSEFANRKQEVRESNRTWTHSFRNNVTTSSRFDF